MGVEISVKNDVLIYEQLNDFPENNNNIVFVK